MDQVRTALAWLKKHHFWVLSGLIPLIILLCWWSGAKKMLAKYNEQQQKITGAFKQLEPYKGGAFHPNDTINKKQEEELSKQEQSVTKLWQQLYEKQRESVLKWPVELRKDFADAVEKMQFNDEIPVELRNRYQNYIDRHFPELPKQIGAQPLDTTMAGGPGGFGQGRFAEGPGGQNQADMSLDNDYICQWLDQSVIRDELQFPERPSSLRIWVTQEDLWVYHTLLDVIAKTNRDANATRQSNAAVRVVFSLEVGPRAAPYSRQPGRLLKAPPAAVAAVGVDGGPAAPPPGESPRGASSMMAEGRGAGPGASGAMSPAQEQAFLMSGRYLDDKGMPIALGGAAAGTGEAPAAPPEPGGSAATSGPAPPLDLAQFGVGYKRLPVRMVLQMDVRSLPQLITNCANQPLRVEVQEVRINPPGIAGLDASTAGGGLGGSPGGGFGGEQRGGGGGGASDTSLFPDHAGIQSFPTQPNVVNVVIQGTIYIFNKPNSSLLQQAPAPTSTAAN